MARKGQLRTLHEGMVINQTSKKQETELTQALRQVVRYLANKYPQSIHLKHELRWHLKDIVAELSKTYPDTDFHYHLESSFIKPDGGILYLNPTKSSDITYPILIAEVKNQGTNDKRLEEGKEKQAKGNAIERLGKNVIGLRTALLRESIFPFVCFGYGCDFEEGSSILDRVHTIAMFGELNKTYLHNEVNGKFNRGSFYFRYGKWTVAEMYEIMKDIAERSILYYFSKYGENTFK